MERKKTTSENLNTRRGPNAVDGLALGVPGTFSWYTLSLVIIDDSFLDSNVGKSNRDRAIADVVIGIHA